MSATNRPIRGSRRSVAASIESLPHEWPVSPLTICSRTRRSDTTVPGDLDSVSEIGAKGMRTYFLFILLGFGLRAAELPRFADYPVDLSKIEHFAKAVVPEVGNGSRCILYLQYDRPSAPDFADHFTLFLSGCGTGCAEFCLIDRVSGAVFPGYGAAGGPKLEYRRDSRLVIIKHTDGTYRDDDLFFADCYVWQGGQFRFLGRWQTTFGKAKSGGAIDWSKVIVFSANEPSW